MKLTLFVINWLVLLTTTGNLFSQSPIAEITYKCTTRLTTGKGYDGRNSLYFSNEKSLFIHNDYPTETKYEEHGTNFKFILGDSEGLPVFKDIKNKYLVYKSAYAAVKEPFIFKDTLPEIEWKIRQESKLIGKFKCFAAEGFFGGRDYEVWFTPDIPVPVGPYKLGGLPGAILEAKAKDGRVVYEFQSYESPVQEKIILEEPKKGRFITWDEFEKYLIGKLLKTESLSNSIYTATNDDPDENYDIEKGKYTTISRYKAKRASKK